MWETLQKIYKGFMVLVFAPFIAFFVVIALILLVILCALTGVRSIGQEDD